MFCEKCGSKLQDGSVFCGKCGAKIDSNNEGSYIKITTTPTNIKDTYEQVKPSPNFYNQPVTSINETLSVSQYIGMLLLLMIPIVNIILIFVWSFKPNTNLNRKNYARAILILSIVMITLSVLFSTFLINTLSNY